MHDETLSPKQMDAAVEVVDAQTQTAIAESNRDAMVVTEIRVTVESLECPHCRATIEGWMRDPRGVSDTCDKCKKPFRVSPDASLRID